MISFYCGLSVLSLELYKMSPRQETELPASSRSRNDKRKEIWEKKIEIEMERDRGEVRDESRDSDRLK